MRRQFRSLVAHALVASLALAAANVLAASQRTFVAATGDLNSCSLVLPCRSFDATIT